ncbi:MAG: hypothetical protein DRG09_01570 [Epsilonproteobacteria bacterium]|nr:MAG: hypothetical protein DRG09_01570 [Campylobacterota bacterium]
MKYTRFLTLFAFTMATLMTGCTGQKASVEPNVNATEKECADINKKLVKTDRFLDLVENTSAFHLEELASALETPAITSSNNKPQMLKDGNKKKAALLEEHQKLGCEMPDKA